MESSFKTKYLIIGAVVAVLTGVIFSLWNTSVAVVALIAQIGLFSAIMVSRFSLWQLLVPVASYGVGYLLTGDPIVAAFSLLYVPVSAVIAISLRKNVSRSATVVLSSLIVGVVAVAGVLATAFLSGISLSAEGIASFISATGDKLASTLVSNVPDSLFTNGLTKEAYMRTIVEGLMYFSLSFAVLFCNIIAFSSTAVTKRVVLSLENGESKLSERIKDWLFVLSKPSAAMFIICYLCLIVGGETLTLPQQIAFNTVMTAIQGGVFVMAFRHLRQRISTGGFAAISMYIVIALFFGLSVTAMVLSGVGVFAAFKQKSKEDNKKCEN